MTYCEKCKTGAQALPRHWPHCLRLRPLRDIRFYPLAGTIFEKSTTSLRTLVLCHVPDGFDSLRNLGESRFSAKLESPTKPRGACFSQIRSLLSERTCNWRDRRWRWMKRYVGGKRKNRSWTRRMRGRDNDEKTPVIRHGRARQGRVIALVTPDVKSATSVLDHCMSTCCLQSIVYTDEYTIYDRVWRRRTMVRS